MKRLLVLTGLAAALSGCMSEEKLTLSAVPGKMEPLLASTAIAPDSSAAQCGRLTAELKAIGVALQAYANKHNGQLPPRLSALVADKYLPASALVSCADPSGGKEGGVPNNYREWSQSSETDEAGSSFLYEFSDAPCKWDWKSYLGGSPSASDVDANKDGVVSWAEAKNWQLLHGDTVQKPTSRPYSISQFPAVRCYWNQYPSAYTNASARTVINLAVDLRTVFVSQPWWEKDQ